MNRSVYFETLGCAKNRVDTEIMLGTLLGNRYRVTTKPDEADAIVVNTCGFLTSAVNESIDRILHLSAYKGQGTCKKIVVAGCMSERYRDSLLEEIPEIDGLIGTSDYTEILSCLNSLFEKEGQKNYIKEKPAYSANNAKANRVLSTKRHFAYLKIAEGCSNMCSFCNIPKLRGCYKSRGTGDILRELHCLIGKGIKEINLISQDSSSYGKDLKTGAGLFNLLEKILNGTNRDFWLRVFYSYPNRYPLSILDLMESDARLVPYIDMPFQHIADPVLEKMNRKIKESEILRLVETILSRFDSIALRTTFMVGFPNETEKEFDRLLQFVESGYFAYVGVFVYSREDNIVSHKYGDPIPDRVKEERRRQLLEAQQIVSFKKNRSQIGQIQKVLVEGISDETELLLQGRNQYQGVDVDGTVLINEGQANEGEFHRIEITDAHSYDLIGRVVQ